MLLALPCDIEDRYTIVAELGHGSHAIVYRAIDHSLDREVAIKVLRSELVDSDVSERFRREIRLTSQLEHPHIAHVYGTGEFMGAPYFVTAIARGASLAERLQRERQLPVDEALSITKEIASALGHAHRAGIIHRDVKPANILLTPDGALLTDFGVARALEHAPGTLATSTGVAVGTLLYMSPEQLCAEKGIDARSDQYALALVLYEMLAGVPAHVAANAEGLRSLRIVGQHTPVRMLRTSVPESVDAALNRALSATPADRFRDIRDFSAVLDGADDVNGAPRVTGSQPTARSAATAGRRSHSLISGAAIGLVIAGVGAFGAVRALRSPSAPVSLGPVFALVAGGDTTKSAAIARALAAELREWPDVRAEFAPRTGTMQALEARVAQDGDGAQVTIALRSDAWPPRSVQVRLPAGAAAHADSLRLLAARVLFASTVAPDSADVPDVVISRGTAALMTYAKGWQAVLRGDLVTAQESFATAARTPVLPQAALWQAVVGSWRNPTQSSAWADAARRSSDANAGLRPGEASLARGLNLMSTKRIAEACDEFTRAASSVDGTFASWYALGECLRADSVVVSDRASPTGFRFRSSYWSALRAYEGAIVRLPTPRLTSLFDRVSNVALFKGATVRRGWKAGSDSGMYAGLPRLSGDSVVVYPLPAAALSTGDGRVTPPSYQAALRRGRARMLDLATALARRAPASFEAQRGLAVALEGAGILDAPGDEPSAISALARALRLASTIDDSASALVIETRVRLRSGDFSRARRTAEQLLARSANSVRNLDQLAAVAVLIGEFDQAESLLARVNTVSSREPTGLPGPIARLVARYAAQAAAGNCSVLEGARLAAFTALRANSSADDLDAVTQRWIAPADWMRLTCPGAPLPYGAPVGDPMLAGFNALRAGDRTRTAAAVRAMAAGRASASEAEIAWDTRFAELWLLTQAADSAAARRRIEATFSDVGGTLDQLLIDVSQSAAFRRALALCDSLTWPDRERGTQPPCARLLREISGE